MKNNYQIIYLNGPSSAGKTPLARALQNTLQKPFLVFGLDQVIFMMPEKLNDWDTATHVPGFSAQPVHNEQGAITGYMIVAGPYGNQMLQTFKDLVVTLARAGNNIIIDDVSIGKEEVDAWRAALKDFKVLWVGVTAPIHILDQREKARIDRSNGLARWQAERVHVGVVYDVMVDTYQNSLDEDANIITGYID